MHSSEGADRGGRVLCSAPRQIVVPPLANPDQCEPFALGDLKTRFSEPPGFSGARAATAAAHQLKTGDAAPAFETKTLGGKPLRLKDYRGKYVPLDLRHILPMLETVLGTELRGPAIPSAIATALGNK